jgi:hypothetical protein
MKLNFHFLFPRKESKGIEEGEVYMLGSDNPGFINSHLGPGRDRWGGSSAQRS